MWIHICLGNHAGPGRESLYDLVEWLVTGLTDLKHKVTVGDAVAPHALNLLFEHFRDEDERIIAQRDFKFGLIATEIPTGNTFNWRDEAPWPERRRSFEKIAPYAQFIWSTVEEPVDRYRRFAPCEYLELGFSEQLVDPVFAKTAPTADFCFYGLSTPYRAAVIAELERHCNILLPKQFLKAPEINSFIASAKIGICFKQSPNWPIPSQTRVGRLLHARRGIAAEFTPWPTRAGNLVTMAGEKGDFAQYCLECLRAPWKARAEQAYERFKATMPMKEIMERLLDCTLLHHSADCTLKGLAGTDDHARIEVDFTAPNEPHLIGTEGGYSIVRRNKEFYAISHSLGPIDSGNSINAVLAKYRPGHIIAADSEQAARKLARSAGGTFRSVISRVQTLISGKG